MRALEHPLFVDQNIQRSVVAELRSRGRDVQTAAEAGLRHEADRVLLEHAHRERRVVLTQDRDFGRLAIRDGVPFIGIVYFRPGDLRRTQMIDCIDAVEALTSQVEPPFIVVAVHRGDQVRVRLLNDVRRA